MKFSASRRVFFVLLGCCWLQKTTASITVIESGKTYPSRPDKHLGVHLWKGIDFFGKLQFVHGNMQLCRGADPTRKFKIVTPEEGIQGTFFDYLQNK